MKILVTGAAGFIGCFVSEGLLKQGHTVVGIDNLSNYYNPDLKKSRVGKLQAKYGTSFPFSFKRVDITNEFELLSFLEKEFFDCVIHLAAQAGVRYSLEAPKEYIENNIVGFSNLVEALRDKTNRIIFASSSSVYGEREGLFGVEDNTDQPESVYAATKKCNEILAAAYSKRYNIKFHGLRFFTVYGPYGRPDMAPWLFTENVIVSKPIRLFNHGDMHRDFTYIDDAVSGVLKVVERDDLPNYAIYNIARGDTVRLVDFIQIVEQCTKKKAVIEFVEHQEGDVKRTAADISLTKSLFGYNPQIPIEEGLKRFIDWYIEYRS